MCGIVGYWDKTQGDEGSAGATLLSMLKALACRGPDSAGVALYAPKPSDGLAVRVKLPESGSNGWETRLPKLASSLGTVHNVATAGDYLSFTIEGAPMIEGDIDPSALEAALQQNGHQVEVVSMGHRLDIVKQVGSPDQLEASHHVSNRTGYHGIGHTRMSTESRVDLSHSQPFWAHGSPDVAIVHNGHITNYHKLRRQYEQRGVKFYTENDSEVIGVYLAEQLRNGLTLEQALQAATAALDGSYSCVAATADAMGYVKDSFSHKPLLIAETEAFAAVATEEVALRGALAGDFSVREAQNKEVHVWRN